MAPTNTMLSAARPVFRQGLLGAQTRQALLRSPRFGQQGRRWQSTAEGAQPSWFKRMWDSPVGVKTVHFWAPVMKWSIVIAGIADLARPAEKLSLTQNAALTATGIIWTRWCFVITPKNYLLAAVNFFLGIVGVVQVSRIMLYRSQNKTLPEAVEDVKEEVKQDAKDIVKA